MPTKKTSPKLNGSADALAQAFRDVILEAVEPLATKEDHEALLSLMKETDQKVESVKTTVADVKTSTDIDRQNNSSQFAEINKTLGKLEKTISK